MHKRPTLPLEVRSAIERASEAIIEESWKTRHLLYSKEDRGFISEAYGPEPPPSKPMPAALQLEYQEHTCALFDAEAHYYPRYAKTFDELETWLVVLARRIEREVIKDTRHTAHDFHCTVSARRKAIKDGLQTRILDWLAESELPAEKETPSVAQPKIGQRIKDLRDECGWTQPQLAERLGITDRTVLRHENEQVTRIPPPRIKGYEEVFKKKLGRPINLRGQENVR